jgi:salicylate hydroxylase
MADCPFEIAVIGGGIVGLQLTLGLLRRNIRVTVYEQAATPREVSAGLGFTSTALECMQLLDPRIFATLKEVGADPGNLLRYANEPNLRLANFNSFEFTIGGPGITCHRGQLLSGLLALIPDDVLKLGKRFDTLEEREDGRVSLRFEDNSEAEADAGTIRALRSCVFG